AVYLHDTNSPGAFSRANRAVSHGCIRLQRPLDLALFLLGDDASEWTIDRIRMAIDLPPLTERGRQFLEENPDFEPLHSLSFRRPVPLWIDYYTLYPDADGTLREHPDTYGYDQVIANALTW
ncbi:MAG: L,D-transpeptidase family protein, partial [Bacteroidaceae bacterium]|nr:L,D-transpeptidase family protein [Bacteroidaceae bacterium]